ncbi:MAG: AfsR/SARP family transcriptional regulator [Senegalia sp. (in: firmicutes)]
MAKLNIYLLGRVEILLNDESIIDKLSHKSIGILNYMAVEKNKKFNRNKIADMFWDSNDFDTSRYNLRYNLWQFRKLFKKANQAIDPFNSDKETICFDEKLDIYVDIENFENDIDDKTTKELENMKKLYKGEFLEGFYIKDSPKFNDWVFYERERLQRNYIKTLYKLKDNYKENNEYQKAISILEDMLAINPLKEELYLEIIKIYIKIGDRKKALKHYNRCVKRLREELNISPAEEIKKAYKEILSSESHIQETLKLNTENSISIASYTPSNIEYYSLSELIDKIMDIEEDILKNIDQNDWIDIYPINSIVERHIEDKRRLENNIVKIKVFKALENIFKILSLNDQLNIIIDEFKYIDDTSLEFIRFISYREKV